MLSKEVIVPIIVTSIAINGGCPIRCDRAKLTNQRMMRAPEVIYGMIVSAGTIPVLSSAP
jgi:hypothetical protein